MCVIQTALWQERSCCYNGVSLCVWFRLRYDKKGLVIMVWVVCVIQTALWQDRSRCYNGVSLCVWFRLRYDKKGLVVIMVWVVCVWFRLRYDKKGDVFVMVWVCVCDSDCAMTRKVWYTRVALRRLRTRPVLTWSCGCRGWPTQRWPSTQPST